MENCIISCIIFFLLTWVDVSNGEIYLIGQTKPLVNISKSCAITGTIEHSRDGRSYASFVGIPYGEIKERFQEAFKAPCTREFKAVMPGPICVQANLGTTDFGMRGEEDCLNLNVYVPIIKEQKLLPVMFWIHGGGFSNGGGFMYGPKYFMDEDVILITFNYRLNVFGFLSTGDEVVPGNAGLKDQVLALKWVQENIKAFGGDPTKVTILGESAGGASVHLLVLSPATTGLFSGAIAQSGSALPARSFNPDGKEEALKLANFLKCPTTENSTQISSREIFECLKELPMEKVLKGMFSFAKRWPPFALPVQFRPVKESKLVKAPFLSRSPWEIITDRAVPLKKIPIIFGITKDEGASVYTGSVLQDPELIKDLDKNWTSVFPRAFELDDFMSLEEETVVVDKVRRFYFKEKPILRETRGQLMNLYSDNYFVHPVRTSAVLTAGEEHPVYLYQFAEKGPVCFMKAGGLPVADEEAQKIGHADELLLQFNMEGAFPDVKLNSEQEKFSKKFVKLWASFAINGKPIGTWGKDWKPLSEEERSGQVALKYFKIDSNPLSYISEDEEWKERMLFWDDLNKIHFQNHFNSNRSNIDNKRIEL